MPRAQMLDAIERFGADVIVHDELNTVPELIQAERDAGYKVVIFEDNGPGQQHAHAVFNELYPAQHTEPELKRWFGPAVYCLRDEFRHATRRSFQQRATTVLLSFGGTDPQRLTFRVLETIAARAELQIIVVAGRGLSEFERLARVVETLRSQGVELELHRDVPLMSELMARADFAFSSAGRTLYELAHMGVPTIVIAQNAIEMSHTFASIENGFLHLGLGADVTTDSIGAAFDSLAKTSALRAAMQQRMLSVDLEAGRDFVVRQILEV